jgi:multiple sugar transport system permease protein
MFYASWFDRYFKWFYTAPAVLFMVVMMAFPILYTGRLSLFEWSMSSVMQPEWIGLDNYAELLKSDRFLNSVRVTVIYTLVSLVFQIVLGVAIALLFERKFKGKNMVKTLFLLPMVATPVVIALVWVMIFQPTFGIANHALRSIGLKPLVWLSSPDQVLPSLIIIEVWQWTPMVALIVMAGLTTIPADLYEAAYVDGAAAWRRIRHISLPLLFPTIMVAVMFRLVDLLKQIDIIYATTQGGPNYASETLNMYGYTLGFQYFNMGLASAMIMLFFALVLVLVAFVNWIKRKGEVAL